MKYIKLLIVFCLMFIPFRVFAVEDEDIISKAVSGILIDAESGKIIYEKDVDKQVAVASLTKMVGQILIMEEIEKGTIKWDDVVTVSKNAADMGGSQIYIEEGEKITIEDLMKGIAMASGNDAIVQMAEVVSGSEAKFVKRMNNKVKELGLKNTHFVNCTGLDEEGHYSSSYDMAIIARELVVKHPEILKFSSVYEDYLRENTDNKFWLVNTNKLVHFYDGADGLKTGHTDASGYCLAATAKRNGLRLIAVVLGVDNATERNNETMKLLDYGFNTVKLNKVKSKGDVLKQIRINKGTSEIVNLVLKNDLNVIEESGISNKKYQFKYEIDDITLPIKKDTIVGKVKVLYKNEVVTSGDICVDVDVDKLSFFELFYKEFVNLICGEY